VKLTVKQLAKNHVRIAKADVKVPAKRFAKQIAKNFVNRPVKLVV